MSVCVSCNANLAAGNRWCGICYTHVGNPEIGRLASPGRRLGAFLLDMLIATITWLVAFAVAGVGIFAGGEEGLGGGMFLGLLVLVAYTIAALMLMKRGTTPGKVILGMRVIREEGRQAGFLQILLREFIRVGMLFFPILWIGHLWILWDRDRQGWHDKLMSTFVVG